MPGLAIGSFVVCGIVVAVRCGILQRGKRCECEGDGDRNRSAHRSEDEDNRVRAILHSGTRSKLLLFPLSAHLALCARREV